MIDDGDLDLVTNDAKYTRNRANTNAKYDNKGYHAAETMVQFPIHDIEVTHEMSI